MFDLMMVGTCCKIACRMIWVMVDGIRMSWRLVDHMFCLLPSRSRTYVVVLKVGKIIVNEYGRC